MQTCSSKLQEAGHCHCQCTALQHCTQQQEISLIAETHVVFVSS